MTTNLLKKVLEHAATWPVEDQNELAEYAREIEARRTGVYTMSDDERTAVSRGLAEADRGEFVADERVAEADKHHQQ
jgi:predicted transcriptional regulator